MDYNEEQKSYCNRWWILSTDREQLVKESYCLTYHQGWTVTALKSPDRNMGRKVKTANSYCMYKLKNKNSNSFIVQIHEPWLSKQNFEANFHGYQSRHLLIGLFKNWRGAWNKAPSDFWLAAKFSFQLALYVLVNQREN